MPVVEVTLVIDHHVRALCVCPYVGHKRGCPNFGQCDRCPPRAPLIERVIDVSAPVYAIYNVFDLAAHVALMREKHPRWSDRQLCCCLYWQGTARKQLKCEVRDFVKVYPDLIIVGTPEACGVNVTATMASAGIVLEWPPTNVSYQVVIAGVGLDGSRVQGEK